MIESRGDNARNYHQSPLYEKVKVAVGEGLLTSDGSVFDLVGRVTHQLAQPAVLERSRKCSGVVESPVR